jgi:hypothetical protein
MLGRRVPVHMMMVVVMMVTKMAWSEVYSDTLGNFLLILVGYPLMMKYSAFHWSFSLR